MAGPFDDTLGAGFPAQQDQAGGILKVLSAMKPQDPAAINPATTAAMAQSRDAVTRMLQRQLKQMDSPFAGLSDVATAAQTALATRGKTPVGATLESLDQNRISKAAQIANTLSQVANREAGAGARSSMTPFQQAQLLLRGMDHAAKQGNREAVLAKEAYNRLTKNLDPESAQMFMLDWHNTSDEIEKRTGKRMSADELNDLGMQILQSGGSRYKTKQTGNFLRQDLMGNWWSGNANKGEVNQVQPGSRPGGSAPTTQWDMTFDQASRETGLPSTLLKALAASESNFDPAARSPKGALGTMQLMPGTAAELGVDPMNPDQNIMGGSRYLKQQMDRYGNLDLALMAYNWGPGNVDKWLQSGGQMKIPPETAAYVTNVKARMMAYDRPAQAGGAPQQIAQAAPTGGAQVPGLTLSGQGQLNLDRAKRSTAADAFNNQAQHLLSVIDQVGASGTGIAGILSTWGGGAVEQFRGVMDSMDEKEKAEFSKWQAGAINSPVFDRLVAQGAGSARIKAGLISLAAAYAKAIDPGGRVTKDDLDKALMQMGGWLTGPRQMRAVIEGWTNDIKLQSGGTASPETFGGPQDALPMIDSEDKVRTLRPGQRFRAPDGSIRTVP